MVHTLQFGSGFLFWGCGVGGKTFEGQETHVAKTEGCFKKIASCFAIVIKVPLGNCGKRHIIHPGDDAFSSMYKSWLPKLYL
jgi:hypothetical protein